VQSSEQISDMSERDLLHTDLSADHELLHTDESSH
jgi:hypothetical protein